jgi:hypothetical protein
MCSEWLRWPPSLSVNSTSREHDTHMVRRPKYTVAFRAAACASILAASLTAAIPGLTAVAAQQNKLTWLAAGDSYASGQGLKNPVGPCARSMGESGTGSTWAVSAAHALMRAGYSFAKSSPDLVACTGAISDQFFNSDGSAIAPQWRPNMGRFDLVTFSFGGDDIGFPSIMAHCATIGCPADVDVRQKISELGTSGVYWNGRHLPSFSIFLRHVATSAVVRGGNVVVMGYPELFALPSTWGSLQGTCSGLSAQEVDMVRGWGGDLNATLGSAVAQLNAEPSSQRNGVQFSFVNPVDGKGNASTTDTNLFDPVGSASHELCTQGQEWLNGFSPRHPLTHSFHPNQAGENALGSLAAAVLVTLQWPTGVSLTGPSTTFVRTRPPTASSGAGGDIIDGCVIRPDTVCKGDMSGSDLQGANLTGADLRNAALAGAILSNANLSGANLNGVVLNGANLEGANLTGANLGNAELVGANLRGANLKSAFVSEIVDGPDTTCPNGEHGPCQYGVYAGP